MAADDRTVTFNVLLFTMEEEVDNVVQQDVKLSPKKTSEDCLFAATWG